MRNLKILFLIILFLSLAVRLWISSLDVNTLAEKIIQDDSFYYSSEAKSLATGHGITSNGYDPASGFHPLWLFIITPFFFLNNLNLSINLVLVLSSVLDFISMVLIYKIARKFLSEKFSIATTALYGFNFFIIAQTLSGLDVVLSTVLILAIFNELIYKKRPTILGLFTGLAILARLDGIFLASVIFFYFICKKNINAAKIFFLIVSAIVLPFFIWHFVNFGTIQQSSSIAVFLHKHGIFDGPFNFYQKINIVTDSFAKVFGAFVHQFGFISDTMFLVKIFTSSVFLLSVFSAIKNYRKFSIIILFVILLALFYGGYMWTVHIRYFTPVVPFFMIALFILLEQNSLLKKYKLNFILIAAIFAVIIFNGIVQWHSGYFPWMKPAFENLAWVEQNTQPQDVLGSFNSGLLSYYSGRKVINLDGLLSFDAIEAMKNKSMYNYMKNRNVSYWIDGSFVNKSIYEKHLQGEEFDTLGNSVYKKVMGTEANFTLLKENWSFVKHVTGREMGSVLYVAKVD